MKKIDKKLIAIAVLLIGIALIITQNDFDLKQKIYPNLGLGLASVTEAKELYLPMAICRDALYYNTCTTWQPTNTGKNMTGVWTDFNQERPCQGGASLLSILELIDGGSNPFPLDFYEPIAISRGGTLNAFMKLVQVWQEETKKTEPWNTTLLVMDCLKSGTATCERAIGAVNVDIIWITDVAADPNYENVPTQMLSWWDDNPDGQIRWASFVNHFGLMNVDGTPATYKPKTVYFLPSCGLNEPKL
jgi:hypothetical protein